MIRGEGSKVSIHPSSDADLYVNFGAEESGYNAESKRSHHDAELSKHNACNVDPQIQNVNGSSLVMFPYLVKF